PAPSRRGALACCHLNSLHFTSTAGFSPPSPVPAGGPQNSLAPLARVICRPCAQFVPSRARQAKTVILSPGFIETSRFHPVRYSTLGGYPSNFQFATFPFWSVTSR